MYIIERVLIINDIIKSHACSAVVVFAYAATTDKSEIKRDAASLRGFIQITPIKGLAYKMSLNIDYNNKTNRVDIPDRKMVPNGQTWPHWKW